MFTTAFRVLRPLSSCRSSLSLLLLASATLLIACATGSMAPVDTTPVPSSSAPKVMPFIGVPFSVEFAWIEDGEQRGTAYWRQTETMRRLDYIPGDLSSSGSGEFTVEVLKPDGVYALTSESCRWTAARDGRALAHCSDDAQMGDRADIFLEVPPPPNEGIPGEEILGQPTVCYILRFHDGTVCVDPSGIPLRISIQGWLVLLATAESHAIEPLTLPIPLSTPDPLGGLHQREGTSAQVLQVPTAVLTSIAAPR